MSNYKTIIFLVLILAISSKNFKKQESPQAATEPRPDIMEVGFKHFIVNANLDLESFVKGARDFCRDVNISEPSREELEALFRQTDVNGDGRMSGEEFKHLIEIVKEEVERKPESSFAQASLSNKKWRRWIQKSESNKKWRRWIQKSESKTKHRFTKW